MVVVVVGHGDREQRRDRSALDDLEAAVGEAPLDVLGAPEMRFDEAAEPRERDDLRVRQRSLRRRLREHVAVAHGVAVGVGPAGHEVLAEAEDGLHR